MDIFEKLRILSDAAKYDAACTSSGIDKRTARGGIGSTTAAGICHSFAGDGRCISLLKVLMTNVCVYDCAYCVNRRSNDTQRTAFLPRELADLTMQFYRRNYIEGLFISSGVMDSPDATCEKMLEALRILRNEYRFNGYIHAKAIPGADKVLIAELGLLADRISVNIEMPSAASLKRLAPQKTKQSIMLPMAYMCSRIAAGSNDLVKYRHAPRFAPAGQSTQMIIGASPDTDYTIIRLAANLYQHYALKRVFYSAYIPVVDSPLLPTAAVKPPLWREHRLYQADWLLRYYGFTAEELLDEQHQSLHPFLDPKSHWAMLHREVFPLEVNKASLEELLRVPGIGVKGAWRIIKARRACNLDWTAVEKIGIVVKRAQYFLLCRGRTRPGIDLSKPALLGNLMSRREQLLYKASCAAEQQISLFPPKQTTAGNLQEELQCLMPFP